jgi:hypothetical protein
MRVIVPTSDFFRFRSCPASLEAGLTRAVLDDARAHYLNDDQVDSAPQAEPNKAKGMK